jgi:hypothetical protein
MIQMRNVNKILVGEREEKNHSEDLGVHRWEGNIREDLREIGIEGVGWVYQTQDRNQWLAHMNTVMNFRVL